MVIPQSLAYAEVAGMPAYTGLYAAALPSIVSAFFASSPYLQTGPVALTSLLTFSALSPLATPGSPAYIGLAALLALIVGAGRIGIGLAKFGAVVSLMSQPVLAGFASAAAFLIVTSQLPTAVGVPDPGGGILWSAFWTLAHPQAWELMAVALSGITIAIVMLGRRLHPLIPGVLIAMGLGIAVSHLTGYDGAIVGTIRDKGKRESEKDCFSLQDANPQLVAIAKIPQRDVVRQRRRTVILNAGDELILKIDAPLARMHIVFDAPLGRVR